MKNSATKNKPSEANKIAPVTSPNKPADAGKNQPANTKNIKGGNKPTPVQVEEEVIPPPPKESNFNCEKFTMKNHFNSSLILLLVFSNPSNTKHYSYSLKPKNFIMLLS